MKKQLSLLACVALAATAAMAQPQTASPAIETRQAELSAWKRYTVDGERFSVSLPTVPAMTTFKRVIRETLRTQRQRNIGAYADGAVYTVHVYENTTGRTLTEFIRDQNRRGRWDGSSETGVTIGEVKGEQLTSLGKPVNETAQYFATEGRLYEFSVVGNSPEDEATKHFFSSIVFGKKVEGIKISDGEGMPFSTPTCEVIEGGGRAVDRRARLVMKPEPTYNEIARQKRVTGTIVLKAVFSCNGSVTDIRAVEMLPHGLTEQAVAASRKIKFVPAVKNGKYVSMWMQLEYNFHLY
jgi:TonB family protein